MVREGERVMEQEVSGFDKNFAETVVDLRVKAPFFNYVLSQKDHRGELMSVSFNAMRSTF